MATTEKSIEIQATIPIGHFIVINILVLYANRIIKYPTVSEVNIYFVNIVSQQEIKDLSVFNFVGQVIYQGKTNKLNTSILNEIRFAKIQTSINSKLSVIRV